MIVITGPQATDEEIGDLAETAGLMGAVPAYDVVAEWVMVTDLYCIPDWERCPVAVADVTIAETCDVTIHQLPARVAQND